MGDRELAAIFGRNSPLPARESVLTNSVLLIAAERRASILDSDLTDLVFMASCDSLGSHGCKVAPAWRSSA
jgi:hypothetical protein